MMEAEEALLFPNYVQASRTLPCEITVQPVFSQNQNYAVVAAGDTLYHLELRHGRVHGRTGLPGPVTGLERGTGGSLFVVAGEYLCRVEGFDVAAGVQLDQQCEAFSVCGDSPILLMEDGTLVLRNSEDLSVQAQGTSEVEEIDFIQGFSGLVCLASPQGIIETLALPDFKRVAENTPNGRVVFLETAGDNNLLFSCDTWNEAASCSPSDLVVQKMFTFPDAPTDAAADSSVTYIYGVIPGTGIQVCMESGEIAWRSTGYEEDSRVVLSDDCETAVIASGDCLDILTL